MYRALLFFCLIPLPPSHLYAQLPNCSSVTHTVYYKAYGTSTSNTAIYNFNITQPVVIGVNPVLNTIVPPQYSQGLTISPNLNSSGPSPTFYTTMNSQYYYYNGTTWVNTGHSAGNAYAVNPGAGGGYIFNLDALTGIVWRYNGKGNSTQILTLTALDKVADIAVTCTGDFYIMSNGAVPQTLKKYDFNGSLLTTYTVTGAPSIAGGGGLAIFGNDVYYDDGTNIVKGTISGSTVSFNVVGVASNPRAEDYANCQSNPYAAQASIDTGYYCGAGPGVKVKATGFSPFTWKVINGSATVIANGDSAMVVPATDTRMVVTSGSANNACGGNTDTFLVLPVKPGISAGGNDTIFICNGHIIPDTLHGVLTKTHPNAVYSILWNPASSILSGINTLYPVINPLSQTSYILTVSTPANKGGCTWRDTVDISVSDGTVDASFTHAVKYGCTADTIIFSNKSLASPGLRYLWNFDDNGITDTNRNTIHIYPHQGVHTVQLYTGNGHCSDTAVATINIDHQLKADFIFGDVLICEGDTIFLDASSSVITFKPAIQKYYWSAGDQRLDSIVNPYYVLANKQNNKILLAIADSLGCTDTIVKEITDILPYPAIEAGPADTTICDGVQLYLPLGISSFVEQYLWQDSATEPNYTVSKSGTYIVQAKNRCGTSSDTIKVTYKNCTVFFPGAFTPNSDGRNDWARLVGNLFGITECDISIYNRFGERVFHTKNKDFGWDGIYKNTPQPLGSYYYYITYVLLGERHEMKGDITLIR